MKIGILTYHRTENYGGCLQALATRILLEKLGHEAFYLDYWPEYHANAYRIFSLHKLIKKNWSNRYNYVKQIIKNYNNIVRLKHKFVEYHKLYTQPFCCPITDSFDTIIYGSDQIWRKQSYGDYNSIYFGINNFVANSHISFSASMGNIPSDAAEVMKIKMMVSHLDKISVRENDLKTMLENAGICNVTQTLDPTLCLDSETWNDYIPAADSNKEKYVLLYMLRGGFNENSVREYAKRKGLKLKILKPNSPSKHTEEIINTAGPIDFLQLIKNAEIVFTSSFHGLAFSLLFEREFFASFSKNASRGYSLLESLGIPERLLKPYSPLPVEFAPIDYQNIRIKLNCLRNSSIKFLTDSLTL